MTFITFHVLQDEYDMLLCAIRETANAKPGPTPSLRAASSVVAARTAPPFSPTSAIPSGFTTGGGGGGGYGALPSPLAGIPGASTELQEVELLLANLKAKAASSEAQQQQQSQRRRQQAASEEGPAASSLRAGAEMTRRVLEDDNRSVGQSTLGLCSNSSSHTAVAV